MSLTHISGDELQLEFKMSFDFTLFLYLVGNTDGEQMWKVTPEFLIKGTWEGTSGDSTFIMNFYESKEASFMMDGNYVSCAFTLETTDDGYKGVLLASSYTENPFVDLPLNFTVNKEFTSISISFTFGGVNYAFTLTPQADY